MNRGYFLYPDEIAFVYNPNYIELRGVVETNEVAITFANPRYSSKSIEIKVSVIEGSAKVYISKFLQLLLFGERSTELYVQVGYDDESYTVNFMCVDGSLSVGERFGQIGLFVYDPDEQYFVRRVRWFKNFPFKVSMFALTDNTRMQKRYDRTTYTSAGSLSSGYNDLDPKDYFPNADIVGVFKVTPNEGGNHVFDESFDYTFHSLMMTDTLVRLNVDNSTCGHYFRWIDPMGQIQYFLFTKGVESIKVTDSDYIEEVIESEGMYFGSVHRPIEKTRTKELKCAAVNLTNDEQEYVKTIVSSVNCEMYLGDNIWIPANVKAGTFSISEKENLQDFEIVAELPISQTQTR